MSGVRDWWEQRRERREVRRRYTSARRAWVRERLTAHLRPKGLGVSVALGVVGVLVLWVWAMWHGASFDPAGVLAVVVPPSLYIAGTWLYYRAKAPVELFELQRQRLESLLPRSPWVVAVGVAEEERRIIVQLLLSDGYSGDVAVDAATCFLAIGNVRHRCETPKAGVVSQTRAIEWRYPDEFTPVVWPLPSGRHEAVVDGIRSQSATGDTIHSVGAKVEMTRRKRP